MLTDSPSCRYCPAASWIEYICRTVLLLLPCPWTFSARWRCLMNLWSTEQQLKSQSRKDDMVLCRVSSWGLLSWRILFYLVPTSLQPWGPSPCVTPEMPTAHDKVQNSKGNSPASLPALLIDLPPTAHPQHWAFAPFPPLTPSSAAASSCPAPIFGQEQWEPGTQHRPFCSAMQSVTMGSTRPALVCCFINTSSSHRVSRIKTSFWNMGAWQVLSRRPDILNPVSVRFSSQQRRHTLFWWCGAKWLLGQCWSLEISLSGGLMTEFFWPEGNR